MSLNKNVTQIGRLNRLKRLKTLRPKIALKKCWEKNVGEKNLELIFLSVFFGGVNRIFFWKKCNCEKCFFEELFF